MQIENVAGVGFPARRTPQKQTQRTIRDRMLGKIVVDDQYVAALMHEVFAHRAARIGSDILQRCGVAGGRAENNGIGQRVMLPQRLHDLRDARCLLTDGYIDADDVLSLLIQDRIERNGRLAGLTVADNQLTLAASDGEHGVDGKKARLHGLIDRLTVDDAGGRRFDRIIVRLHDFSAAVDRRAERIDHAPKESLSNRDTGRSSAPPDGASGLNGGLSRKNDAADASLPQVEHHAAHTVFKNQDLAVFRAWKAADLGDPVAVGKHGADLRRRRLRPELPQRLFQQWDHIAPAADRSRDPILQLTAFSRAAPIIDQLSAFTFSKLQPEAVLHAFVPLPAQADGPPVFLIQKCAQLRLLRRSAAVYARLKLQLLHVLCPPLDRMQKVCVGILRVGNQLIHCV